jgi:hypothetical protein
MKSALIIVMRNPDPKREPNARGTWMVHTRGADVSLTIDHDSNGKPYIASKNVALAEVGSNPDALIRKAF